MRNSRAGKPFGHLTFVLLTLFVAASWAAVPKALAVPYSIEQLTNNSLAEGKPLIAPAPQELSEMQSLKNSNPAPKTNEAARAQIVKSYGQLPLSFEVNEGQTASEVRYLSRGSGYNLYLTPQEAVLVLSKAAQSGVSRPGKMEPTPAEPRVMKSAVVRMQLVGSNKAPGMRGEEELPGKSNYLIGSDPKKWRTNVSNYEKVRYEEVYPGIDLVYYGNQRRLEYDFVVQPGANPKAIQLSFEGIESYSIENGGDLVLHTAQGDVIQKKPVIYQQIKGQRVAVAGNYMFLDDNRVAFHLGAYDKTQPLVIDPVLAYSTFLGGDNFDSGEAIAVDVGGNAYVAGSTLSPNFPTQSPLPGGDALNSSGDAFVTKLNVAGSALVYSTFLGGDQDDVGLGIAVDTDGNAYVTGRTFDFDNTAGFPTTPGAFDETHNGDQDVFVAKLGPTGNALVYSTFLGGSDTDSGLSITVDADGNAYVAGLTEDDEVTDFPTTPGAFDETHNGEFDAFVTKLNPAGNALVYSSFLGGDRIDEVFGIAVDAAGNAYVTGFTQHAVTDFPTTPGAFDETHNDVDTVSSFDGDVFVTKLNATGSGLVYSTFLGTDSTDRGFGIAVDADGNAYVTGRTEDTATDFPVTAGAFDETHNGISDVFVTKLNATGSGLVYSTFLGGDNFDEGSGIVVDADGNAYVTGRTNSPDFPTTAGAFDETFNGDLDVLVAKLNVAGSGLVYSTFLGGDNIDQGFDIAVDIGGNAYVTGFIHDGVTDFPTTPGAFDETHNGIRDVFVSKIGESIPVVDTDGDGVADDQDNCPADPNFDQTDSDGDGAGDACDGCPFDPDNDADGDSICGDVDNCPAVSNTDQADTDGDDLGDACDACPFAPDVTCVADIDNDGVGDASDNCPATPNTDQADGDADGFGDVCDVCPLDPDNDIDGDGLCADVDNCPTAANANQTNTDGLPDGGDACDADDDEDGVPDIDDNCPLIPNPGQEDSDGDGAGDVCDLDADNDGVLDVDDACLNTPLGEVVNASGCSIADLCPCESDWKNHGTYVRCVAHTSEDFVADGLITEAEKDATVSSAGESICGHKK